MHYIVFDLEFNQAEHPSKDNKSDSDIKCPFEIIQIGAIKLDENLNVIGSFNRLVNPQVYRELNKYVKAITNLTIEALNNAKDFSIVYNEFLNFIKGEGCVLCVWGTVDLKELIRNVKYHSLDVSSLPKDYIDIQKYATKYLKCPKGTSIGLQKAIELLEVPLEHNLHDAYNDAYYTAEVFRKIFDKSIKPKKYETYRRKSSNKEKYKVDTESMYFQFEKMLNRTVTEEEKSIIRLAYMMGKTNQFLIESPNKGSKNNS
ncbi:3'-5' exonuclease [Clostridium omnivorum]|uniref:Exonuclease n=1 Tax=Clostridium omnivorum TaxID=1604902 RepID=A0ABQ5N121_9CLOT|nr:3'-5' exonuclease [Clostridium sp. E14]GLC28899.1 exonuclease [Clostridium sp. E14]